MNIFGENLKKHRIMLGLSQKEFGQLLELKQTTIANYENGLRFPKGDNLQKIAFLLNVSIDMLIGNKEKGQVVVTSSEMYNNFQEKFAKSLLNWDENNALRLIKDLEKNSISTFDLYEIIITKTLYDVGILWSLGRLSIIQEHFATQVCQKAVAMLSHHFENAESHKQSALCMTINSEEHNLGIQIISDVLKSQGILSYMIGTKIPTNSLITTLIKHNITYLALSVSMKEHLNEMSDLISILRNNIQLKNLYIIAGGHAFDGSNELAIKCGADLYAKDSYDLVEKLKQRNT